VTGGAAGGFYPAPTRKKIALRLASDSTKGAKKDADTPFGGQYAEQGKGGGGDSRGKVVSEEHDDAEAGNLRFPKNSPAVPGSTSPSSSSSSHAQPLLAGYGGFEGVGAGEDLGNSHGDPRKRRVGAEGLAEEKDGGPLEKRRRTKLREGGEEPEGTSPHSHHHLSDDKKDKSGSKRNGPTRDNGSEHFSEGLPRTQSSFDGEGSQDLQDANSSSFFEHVEIDRATPPENLENLLAFKHSKKVHACKKCGHPIIIIGKIVSSTSFLFFPFLFPFFSFFFFLFLFLFLFQEKKKKK